jgi:DnaJ homolog subfamily C member 17
MVAPAAFLDDEDFYFLLGFDSSQVDVLSLTPRDIASSYRRQALRWHPDKNPGDANAKEMLARVFVAHETLADPERRVKYDDVVRARRARDIERAALDADRRRMRDDLERRERESQAKREREHARARDLPAAVEARLQREIERLRVDHGLSSAKAEAGSHQMDQMDSGGSKARSAKGRPPWVDVPGYKQWSTGEVNFEDLEAAVLARARGLIPSGPSKR